MHCHDILKGTVTLFLFPGVNKIGLLGGEFDSPDCVTVTDCEFTPFPDMVIVPTLEVVEVLAVKVAVIIPLPLLLAGLTVNQVALSETVQLVFELTLKVVIPASEPISRLTGETDKVFIPACITITVSLIPLCPVSVMLAVRELVEVFS